MQHTPISFGFALSQISKADPSSDDGFDEVQASVSVLEDPQDAHPSSIGVDLELDHRGLALQREEANRLKECISDLGIEDLLIRSEPLTFASPCLDGGTAEGVERDPRVPRLLLAHQGWGTSVSTVSLGWGLRGQRSTSPTQNVAR